MGNIKERVAYLQGLTQGLNVSSQSAEGKLLVNIIDVLDDMAEEFTHIQMVQEDLETYVESMDDDLTDLEEEIYEDVAGDESVEVQCPSCHETVSFESNLLEDEDEVEVSCPHCGDIVYDSALEIEATDIDDGVRNTDFRYGIHPGI
jgi:predicted  nucleic acid-binding Zn-ribbon protein